MSYEDLRTVAAQLGRWPEGALAVVVRCRYGRPQVIASRPLRVDGKAADTLPAAAEEVAVFPTLYWLTCPMLQAAIGRLEAAGWVGRLRDELRDDPQAATELREAHRRTAEVRTRLLTAATLEELRTRYPRQFQILTESGVAGMRDVDGTAVKCLHAHFADYLATGANPVGRRVWALLTAVGIDPRGGRDCFAGHDAACPQVLSADDTPRAVIDVGSNSVRLLVARRTAAGWERVAVRLITTRLGATEGGDRRLTQDAIERTVAALRTLREAAEAAGAGDPVAVATSAVREAPNRDVLLVQAWERAGVAVRVVTGEEEGELSFRGALAGTGIKGPGPVLLVDVGGGSTEIIAGDGGGTVHVARSLPFGAVRLHAAVAAGNSMAVLLQELRTRLSETAAVCAPYLGTRRAVAVAVGGTATTVAALDQEMRLYDYRRINGYTLTAERLAAWRQRLEAMDLEERCRLAGMPDGRADIAPYGLIILEEVVRAFLPWAGPELVISDDDLLLGCLEQAFGSRASLNA